MTSPWSGGWGGVRLVVCCSSKKWHVLPTILFFLSLTVLFIFLVLFLAVYVLMLTLWLQTLWNQVHITPDSGSRPLGAKRDPGRIVKIVSAWNWSSFTLCFSSLLYGFFFSFFVYCDTMSIANLSEFISYYDHSFNC